MGFSRQGHLRQYKGTLRRLDITAKSFKSLRKRFEFCIQQKYPDLPGSFLFRNILVGSHSNYSSDIIVKFFIT
jgi:hypothetical protein